MEEDYINIPFGLTVAGILWLIVIIMVIAAYIRLNRRLNRHIESPHPADSTPRYSLAEYAQMDVEATRRALGVRDIGDETFFDYDKEVGNK